MSIQDTMEFYSRLPLQIDGRIHIVYILQVQLFSQQLNSLTKALEVNDFPLPQEFDHIVYIRIIRNTQNIIIGRSGLLFCQGVP